MNTIRNIKPKKAKPLPPLTLEQQIELLIVARLDAEDQINLIEDFTLPMYRSQLRSEKLLGILTKAILSVMK